MDALVVAGLARHSGEHGAQVGIGPEVAYPAGLAGVAQQGLHDRQRADLGVAGHRSDTDLWAWWQDLGVVHQQVIDSDVLCSGEGLQAGVHERTAHPSTYADSPLRPTRLKIRQPPSDFGDSLITSAMTQLHEYLR